MKVKMIHTVEYEVEIDDDSFETAEEMITNATNELVHSGSATLAGLQTGVESWRCSAFGG